MLTAGIILMCIGMLFSMFGMIGLFRFRHFYARILITSNIDVAGMLILMVGAMLQAPSVAFMLKIIIIAVLSLITSPLSAHAVMRSARESGYRLKHGERI